MCTHTYTQNFLYRLRKIMTKKKLLENYCKGYRIAKFRYRIAKFKFYDVTDQSYNNVFQFSNFFEKF